MLTYHAAQGAILLILVLDAGIEEQGMMRAFDCGFVCTNSGDINVFEMKKWRLQTHVVQPMHDIQRHEISSSAQICRVNVKGKQIEWRIPFTCNVSYWFHAYGLK